MSAARPLAVSMVVAAVACASFKEPTEGTGTGADAGAEAGAGTVTRRDLRVVVERPADPQLDPSSDSRAAKIRVVVTDTTDATRTKETSAEHRASGPFEFPQFESSALVDVVVMLTAGDDRLLGYAHAKPWDLRRDTTITVALRRRIVYFISDDSPSRLRVLDLAPAARGEPAMEALDDELESLPSASALALTRDGRTLIEAGAPASGSPGALAIFETGSNAAPKLIGLPFAPTRIALLDEDRTVLAYPGNAADTTELAKIDLASGNVERIPSGRQGGRIVVADAFASYDGSRAYAAASYYGGPNVTPKGYLLVHRSNEPPTNVELPDVNIATGVRLTPDGGELVVTGHSDVPGVDGHTGRVLFYHPNPTTPRGNVPLETGTSQTESFFISKDGRRGYVSLSTQYPSTGACCASFIVVDLPNRALLETFPMANNGPEYALASAVQLPYAPGRLLAGQTDPGNNVHPEIVEIADGESRPRDLDVANVFHPTVLAMVTPFGQIR